MSRVLTFSRTFPAYHPKAGQPTFFVEKITKNLHHLGTPPWDIPDEIFTTEIYYIVDSKRHTIRSGNRWKVGDKFSPRVWSGKPYQSKQIIIAPDIEVKKVFDIYLCFSDEVLRINDCAFGEYSDTVLEKLAANDGLSLDDLIYWFGRKPFFGQIICWDKSVIY